MADSSGDWKPKVKVPAWLDSGKGSLVQVVGCWLLALSSHGGRGKLALWVLVYKGINLIHEALLNDLINSLIPSHWALQFQHTNWGKEGLRHSISLLQFVKSSALTQMAQLSSVLMGIFGFEILRFQFSLNEFSLWIDSSQGMFRFPPGWIQLKLFSLLPTRYTFTHGLSLWGRLCWKFQRNGGACFGASSCPTQFTTEPKF